MWSPAPHRKHLPLNLARLLFSSSDILVFWEDFFWGADVLLVWADLFLCFSEASIRACASRIESNSARVGSFTLHNSRRRMSSLTPSWYIRQYAPSTVMLSRSPSLPRERRCARKSSTPCPSRCEAQKKACLRRWIGFCCEKYAVSISKHTQNRSHGGEKGSCHSDFSPKMATNVFIDG